MGVQLFKKKLADVVLFKFKVRQFIIRLTRDSFISLKRTIAEKKIQVLTDVVEDHLLIDQFDGLPRTQQQMYVHFISYTIVPH